MQQYARPLSDAERELIELVRGEDSKNPFTLVISFSEGHWVVETRSPGLTALKEPAKTSMTHGVGKNRIGHNDISPSDGGHTVLRRGPEFADAAPGRH